MIRVPRRPDVPHPSEATPRQPGFIARRALWSTVPPALIYIVQTLYLKIQRIEQENVFFAGLSLLSSWATDLLFATALVLLFTWLLSSKSKPVRVAAGWVYGTIIIFSMIFTAAYYGYLTVTGSALTWGVIRYWLGSLSSSTGLVTGEATPEMVAWLAVPLAGFAGQAAVLRRQRAGSGRTETAFLTRGRSWAFAAALGALLLVLGLSLSTVGGLGPEERCVAFEAFRDLVPNRSGEIDIRSLSESDRFDDAWVFERDPAVPQLNVVLIIFESLSWQATDVYRPGLGTTPFLAGLAKYSMVVRNFYTVVPHTTKALVPLLAGIYPDLDHFPKEAWPGFLPRKSLAYVLRDQGYATAFFQTAENFELRQHLVANLGYETYENLFSMPQEEFEDVNYFGKEERMMLRPSLAWVDANRNRPFFLTYLTLSTHHQYGIASSFPHIDFGVKDPDHQRYLNAVRYIDGFIESVLAEFRARGMTDRTLFLIVGDHGEAFGEHSVYQHNQVLWEEGLRTLAMLYGPARLSPGTVIEGTRSLLDVIPTVCDVLGLRLTGGRFLGQSLLGPVPADRKLFFSGWSSRDCLAVREGPVKVIYHYEAAPAEVYDNAVDLFDRHDLAGREPYTEDFIRVRSEEMLQWKAVVDLHYALWELEYNKKKQKEKAPAP